MDYMERGTMTGQALRYLTDKSFSPGQGARPGVTKVGIVFTDGRSQDYIGEAAKKAKENGEGEIERFSHVCVQYVGRRVLKNVFQASRCTLLEWATPWRMS